MSPAHDGSSGATRLEPVAVAVGHEAEQQLQQEHGRRRRPTPAAAPRSDTRSGTASRRGARPGEHLRELPAEVGGRVEHAAHDLLALLPVALPREAPRDQGVVVGPHGAVVVAERVEAGVVGRHRADAPARPERRRSSAGRRSPRRAPGGTIPVTEQVPDVRGERVDAPLLAVERERVEAAALLDPERLVERASRARPPRARAGRRARGRATPSRAISAMRRSSRRRRSPAPRTARSAPVAMRPSWKRCESARVLPRLHLEPVRRAPLELDEAVAVAVAPLVDPAQRRERRLLQLVGERRVVRPAPRPPRAGRGRAASRRRCRSSGRTSARQPCRGAPRGRSCRARRRSTDRRRCAWSSASARSAVRASSGPEQQRLQARDDRVAAEDGHEPRHPGGGQLAEVAVGAHPQRGEVADRAGERLAERVPARAHLRHVQLPRDERVLDVRELVAERAAGRGARSRRRRRGAPRPRAPSARGSRARPPRRRGRRSRPGQREQHLVRSSPSAKVTDRAVAVPARPATGGGSGVAFSGSPSVKSWSLTAKMSAKSQPSSSPTSNRSGSIDSLRITIRSCSESPTKRERAIESASCGRSASGLRR